MVKLDLRLMGFITTFENITRAKVKDVFFDKNDILVFIVKQGEIGKAIGKKGFNIKKISSVLKKRIKVIEFNNSVDRFVKNILLPLKVDTEKSVISGATDSNKPVGVFSKKYKVIIKCSSRQDKGIVIGRDKTNLNALKELVSKFFDAEISVE